MAFLSSVHLALDIFVLWRLSSKEYYSTL